MIDVYSEKEKIYTQSVKRTVLMLFYLRLMLAGQSTQRRRVDSLVNIKLSGFGRHGGWYYAGICLKGLNKPLRGNSKYLI